MGMPSDSEDGDELVFLSPEEEPPTNGTDTGASPVLRRSARKRKSTAADDSMVKESSSKKKKSSPKMPKVARSPPKGQGQVPPPQEQANNQKSFEDLLLAMEGRIMAKLEKASADSREAAHQAKLNSEGIEQLESRVDANEACLMEALAKSESRIMAKVQEQVQDTLDRQVKDMVNHQLAAAGFDQDLSAGDLSVRNSAMKRPEQSTNNDNGSYAGAVASAPRQQTASQAITITKEARQEERLQEARRSLRLWPLNEGSKAGLLTFLKEKLRMDETTLEEEIEGVTFKKVREPRNKNKNEYVVTFDNKQVRDSVKAMAPNLASHREEAGMRLHVPDHLQRDFHALMNLSYDLKRKHSGLKRNIKFDEEDGGLFMDIKLGADKEWRRVKPEQAKRANKMRRVPHTRNMDEEELESLLGESEDED